MFGWKLRSAWGIVIMIRNAPSLQFGIARDNVVRWVWDPRLSEWTPQKEKRVREGGIRRIRPREWGWSPGRKDGGEPSEGEWVSREQQRSRIQWSKKKDTWSHAPHVSVAACLFFLSFSEGGDYGPFVLWEDTWRRKRPPLTKSGCLEALITETDSVGRVLWTSKIENKKYNFLFTAK